MKSISKFLALAAIVLFASVTVLNAQKKGTPQERADKKTERLTKELNLSSEQTEQVRAIYLAYAEKAAEARANSEEKEKGKRKGKGQRGENREAMKAELKTVLTEEQFAKFETMKPKKKGKGRKGKKGEKNIEKQ